MVSEDLPKVDYSRAVSNHGDRTKIAEVMRRAYAGEEITVGFIGGSITQGSLSSTPEKCYAYKVYEWFWKSFPSSHVKYVNAGIGATDSQYACARVDGDLLEYKPDMVFVEFSVNDESNEHFHETYEGLVRKILKAENNPALMLIHNVRYNDGGNAEIVHSKVARHYDVPSVSMQQVIYPELVSGRLENRLITPDDLHPNDLGHALVASVIISVLEEIRKESKGDADCEKTETILPEPETKNAYEDSVFYNAVNAGKIVASLEGFENDHEHKTAITDLFKDGWYGSKFGSSIEFKAIGSCISILYRKAANRLSPRVEVILDDSDPVNGFLDGMFYETWGDKMEIHNVLEHGECREHKVVIWIYEGKDDFEKIDAEKECVPFYISGIIVSGREKG